MPPNHPKRPATIPLIFREIVLRVLLTSAAANVLLGIPLIAFGEFGWRFYEPNLARTIIVCPVTPLFVILHHTLRLWPRRYWLVVCEVLSSLVEAALIGAVLLPNFILALPMEPVDPGDLATCIIALFGAASLILSASLVLAFVFLSFDLFNERGKTILQQYDFSVGLCRPGRQWSFIWGRWTTRRCFRQFSYPVPPRGLAIICLFGILSLALYSVVLKPIQDSMHPSIKISKVPVHEGDSVFGTLISIMERPLTPQWCIVLAVPVTNTPNGYQYHPTVSVRWKKHPPKANVLKKNDCKTSTYPGYTLVIECSPTMFSFNYVESFEPLIVIDFPEAAYDSNKELHDIQMRPGVAKSAVEDILTHTDPVFLGPGANLLGLPVISVKQQFSRKKAATLGIPQYRPLPVVNMRALSPDWVPSIPRNNHTATFRVAMQAQAYIEVEQEYVEGSVLDGFALVGGVWTLVNGIFAAIFGSTLLLVLFGIKPLSIYGMIHYLRPGRGSLVDANYVLSPEERDRIVGILREHLLDVDDIEGDRASGAHYNRVSTLSTSVRPFT